MRCAKHMKYSIVNENWELCHFRNNTVTDQFGQAEPEKCWFAEDRYPGVKASIMFLQYIPQVSFECLMILRQAQKNIKNTTKSVSL